MLDLDLCHGPTLEHLRRYGPHLEKLLLAARALAKAQKAGATPEAWEQTQACLDSGLTWDAFLAGGPRQPERFLFRAAVFLHSMAGESTRVDWNGGRPELYWAKERAPEPKELALLAERLRLAARQAERESGGPAPEVRR